MLFSRQPGFPSITASSRRTSHHRAGRSSSCLVMASSWLRGLAVVLLVTSYLAVFLYWEQDLSYETVVAINRDGEAAMEAVLQERNATRIRRAKERQERHEARTHGELVQNGSSDADTGDEFNLWRFLLFYMLLRFLLRSRMEQDLWQQQSSRAGRRAQRLAAEERQRRFQAWAEQLNQQRVAAGQRPLSLESLQLVLRERELHDGQDYDGLLQFNEESGPAMEALIHSGGLTEAEMERLPRRVVQAGDDLLRREDNDGYFCSVCLEAFCEGDSVRTVPCFHTFHERCINDWLSRRAICPICKHSALA